MGLAKLRRMKIYHSENEKDFRKFAVLNDTTSLKTAFYFDQFRIMNTNSTLPETLEEQYSPGTQESDTVHISTDTDVQHQETRSGEFAMASPSFAATTAPSAPTANAPSTKYGTLFVVSTPIGNNDDITLRALKILKQSDIVVGEEGKTVARLLHDNRITKKLEELNEHNENEQTNRLLQLLKNGKTLSLVSDAGTPLLADPGTQLVRRAIDAGITVRAIPGVTSIMTALTTSGLPMDSFVFAGFVSREPSERLQELKRLAQEARTVVLLETPYRLVPLLEAARQIMPQRRAYLGCNLTMDSETHHYGTVSELYTKFVVSRFKGEFVFCFEGAKGGQSSAASPPRDDRKPFAKGDFKREGGFKREGKFDRKEGRFDRKEGKFDRKPDFKREGEKRFDDKREGEKRFDDKRSSGRYGNDKRDGDFKREGGFKGGDFKRGGDSRRSGDFRGKPQPKGKSDESPKDNTKGNSSAPNT